MTSVFIKVLVSERLPSEDGYYFVLGKHGSKRVSFFDFETGFCERVSYWIEEIKLPTEKELKVLEPLDNSLAGLYDSGFYNGVNFILDKLKKQNNGFTNN